MDLVAERCAAQLLTPGSRARTAEQVTERLLAVQAQDPRGFRLAIRARTAGTSVDDVDRSLSQDRSLVVTWLNRGTLHLVGADDLALLHALTTPQLRVGNARRLGQEGVSPDQAERGTRLVVDALADGPQTRPQLRDRLEAAGVPVAGQALVHVLMRTCLLGLAVRGPMVGPDQAYVLAADWLGRPLTPPADPDAALAELARRYLVGHAPATDVDLARWAGIPLGSARRGLAGVRGLRDLGGGLVGLPGTTRPAVPPPLLLGPFDPLLLGWADRRWLVGDHGRLVTSNGVFRPFALVGGRAVGSWAVATAALTPFEELDPAASAALELEAEDVRRFLRSARYR